MFLPTLTNTDLPGPPDWVPDSVLDIFFWPVAICLRLSGPGVNIGTPEKPLCEGTPLQLFASDVGVGVSWIFYVSLVFLFIWIRRRHRDEVSANA